MQNPAELALVRAILVMLLAATGCQDALETGYVPRKLNASDPERRSYYAPAFTPESRPSKDEHGPAPDLSMPTR